MSTHYNVSYTVIAIFMTLNYTNTFDLTVHGSAILQYDHTLTISAFNNYTACVITTGEVNQQAAVNNHLKYLFVNKCMYSLLVITKSKDIVLKGK